MRRGGGGSGGGGGAGSGGNGGRRGGPQRSQNFDSSGPDIKVRGTAQQVVDKYQTLAREAATAGDPVAAENYYQHAEHYYRVMHANGGGENRQGGRPQDGDRNEDGERNQDGERHRDDNEPNEMRQAPEIRPASAAVDAAAGGEQPAIQPAAQPAAQPAVQPTDGRRNGPNGRRRSRPAAPDSATHDPATPGGEAESAAPQPASASEETGEPVT
jgi:hypothetical protein